MVRGMKAIAFPPAVIPLVCLAVSASLAEERPVTPQVESVGLFKNGLTVVRMHFPVQGPGAYRWDEVPRVVHGTFWVESEGELSIQATTRPVETTDTGEFPTGSLQADLEGHPVTVHLKAGAGLPGESVRGSVWRVPTRPPVRPWSGAAAGGSSGSFAWRPSAADFGGSLVPPSPGTGGFLVLEVEGGSRRYIDTASIASVEATGPFVPRRRTEHKPVLVFNVAQAPPGGGSVRVSYLTRGLAWAPSYRIDLTDANQLTLRQNSLVRNELMDLASTDLHLISGFPNIQFSQVDSPLWAGTSLSAFFQQLSQPSFRSDSLLGNSMSQAVFNRAADDAGAGLPDLAESGGAQGDVHYQSIGHHDLAAGDTLSLEIARATTPYERIVEWVIPDQRDEYGRYRSRSGGRRDTQDDEDQAWDAVQFKNPFSFPMTTAPAVVVEGGHFRGQSLSQWVNPGQETSLHITKALSVRTEHTEREEEGAREVVWISRNDYQRTKVTGTLKLNNFRSQPVTVSVRGQFSGTLLRADGDPVNRLRTEGVSTINPQRELRWKVTLTPGEERAISYEYSVLVDI